MGVSSVYVLSNNRVSDTDSARVSEKLGEIFDSYFLSELVGFYGVKSAAHIIMDRYCEVYDSPLPKDIKPLIERRMGNENYKERTLEEVVKGLRVSVENERIDVSRTHGNNINLRTAV